MANLKFYMTPGSCSTGIHILLEELELVFEAYIVNLPAGDQFKPEFVAINPKSTIPVLVKQDGTPITDFVAIAWWLAKRSHKAGLLPADIEQESAVIETMNHIVGTIHMLGYTRIFTTDNYVFSMEDHARVKAQGEVIVKKGFTILNRQLAGKGYLFDSFSIADAALFYIEFWADRIGLPLPENCQAHYRLMLSRPVVQRVLREEGYNLPAMAT